MPKLHTSDGIIKVLQRKGFAFISQRGSHAKFQKKTRIRIFTVIIPANKKEIPHGTFRSILRQSGLRAEDFE